MELTRMANLTTIAVLFFICNFAQSQRFHGENDPRDWKPLARGTRSTDAVEESIREVFQRISSGTSDEKDDEELVRLIKEGIVETANKIKTPAASIEAAARRAQRLVSELTSAYTTAIYKSKSTEDARASFIRFRNTIQQIVDFIKKGQFVT